MDTELPPPRTWEGLLLPPLLLVGFIASTGFLFKRILEEIKAEKRRVGDKFGFVEIIRYRADLYLSHDAMAMPTILFTITLHVILVGGFLVYLFESDPECSLSGAMWLSWIFVADAAAHAEYGPSLLGAFVSFVLTLGGMLVFGFLVGILTDMIGTFFDELKKGKSLVLESNHSLILNWNNKTLPLIAELCIANESEGGGVIVVMAERNKTEMEEDISNYLVNRRKGSTIVVRSGSPLHLHDLKMVSPKEARSIVILSEQDLDSDERDSMVLRAILGIKSLCTEKEWNENMKGHIVVEAMDPDNMNLMTSIGFGRVEGVLSYDMVGRIMVRCAQTPGLSLVLEELLGFEGHEFYLSSHVELVGKTFREALVSFPEACVLGIKPADESVVLNPDNNYTIKSSDQLVFLAEDDDTYEYAPIQDPKVKAWAAQPIRAVNSPFLETQSPQKYLILGFRKGISSMIRVLDHSANKGSELIILSSTPKEERDEVFEMEGGFHPSELRNLFLTHVYSSASLLSLSKLDLLSFASILILTSTEGDSKENERQDSRALQVLLLARDLVHRASHIFHPLDVPEIPEFSASPMDADARDPSRSITSPKPRKPGSDNLDRSLKAPPQDGEKKATDRSIDGKTNSKKERGKSRSLSRALARSKSASAAKRVSQTKRGRSHVLDPKRLSLADQKAWGRLVLNGQRWDDEVDEGVSRRPSISQLKSIDLPIVQDEKDEDSSKPWAQRWNSVGSTISGRKGSSRPSIISEVLDPRTKNVLRKTKASGFVASNELVSQILAMVAERREVRQILKELIEDIKGFEMELQPVSAFLAMKNEKVSFVDLLTRNVERQQIVIGYKRASSSRVVLNPSNKFTKQNWGKSDSLVVIVNHYAQRMRPVQTSQCEVKQSTTMRTAGP